MNQPFDASQIDERAKRGHCRDGAPTHVTAVERIQHLRRRPVVMGGCAFRKHQLVLLRINLDQTHGHRVANAAGKFQCPLVRIQMADGTGYTTDHPAKYTLELQGDGRAMVRADCNRGSGSYRMEGRSLTFGPLATTRAACPPGSLSDRWLQQLGLVATFTERDGRLVLATRADGATLELQPAPGQDGLMSGSERCTRSGGTVEQGSCCRIVGDFPNTCLLGACGCAPEDSHVVQVCRCPAGRCFDGKSCVPAGGPPGGQLR
jgi:heat shock protein HslJ